MPGDMTKPRKKKYALEEITDSKQRAFATCLKPIIDSTNLTLNDFAEVQPKVSVATLGNIFNPKYGKCPSPRIMKLLDEKISIINTEYDAVELYKQFLRCDDKRIEDFPFEKEKDNESLALSNVEIENVVLKRLMNLPISGRVVDNFTFNVPQADELVFDPPHSFAVDYTQSNDNRISHWVFDISVEPYWFTNTVRDFIYGVLIDGAANTVKYSLITNSEPVFNHMSNLKYLPLNVYVSVILYKDGKLIEKNIETSADQSILEEVGLKL